MRHKGKVKWMDAKKGIGMITSPELEGDVFFHYSELKVRGFKYLPPESNVVFDLLVENNGRNNGQKACNIEHVT